MTIVVYEATRHTSFISIYRAIPSFISFWFPSPSIYIHKYGKSKWISRICVYEYYKRYLYSSHDFMSMSSSFTLQKACMKELARRLFVINGTLRSIAARRIL